MKATTLTLSVLLALMVTSCMENSSSESSSSDNASSNGNTLQMNTEYKATLEPYVSKSYKFTMPRGGLFHLDFKTDLSKNFNISIKNSDSLSVGTGTNGIAANLKAGEYVLRIAPPSLESKITIPFVIRIDSIEVGEYNDNMKNATPIVLGQSLRGKLYPRYDMDYFSFTLTKPTVVKMTWDSISSNLSPKYWLYDSEGSILKYESYTNNTEIVEAGWMLKAGTYYLNLESPYNIDQGSEKAYRLLVQKYTIDTLEYNNDTASASTMILGQSYSGNIWPAKDLDYYKVEIKDTGDYVLNISNISSKLALFGWELQNAEQVQVNTENYVPGQLINIKKPGIYYLILKDKGYLGVGSEMLYTVNLTKK